MRQLDQVRTALAQCPRDLSDTQRIDLIRCLEELKSVAAAAQATTAVDLDESQRAQQVTAGTRPARVGEGIAQQLALARRESPHKGARLLGLAKILHREMPHTLALMRGGHLNEWRATILARETACLSLADRRIIDETLCATGHAATLSDRALERAAKKLAYELDPHSTLDRARYAESQRHVTIRPAPDTMCFVTALLPVAQAVRVYAVLLAAADAARAAGAGHTRGQVMADTLTERITGQPADQPPSVEVKLVMSEASLLAGADHPAHLTGYGPVPAPWARALVTDALTAAQAFIRRLYTTPATGELIAMDSRARLAPPDLADLITTRDHDLCRTPWCGAPIRETDHARAWTDGGHTTHSNLQGLCQRCNHAKQAAGWHAAPVYTTYPTRHTIETLTPTGHRHRTRAPAPPGHYDITHPQLTLELTG